MLHNALDRAVKERLIVHNPADDCVPPKIPKHEMKILPPKRWAISWRRSCEKGKEKTQNGGENDTIILSATLWTFRRVGHGVGQANSPPENPNK